MLFNTAMLKAMCLFSGDHTGISNNVQCMGNMASSTPCFSMEVLYFIVKYHVAIDKWTTIGSLLTVWYKYDFHIFHFFFITSCQRVFSFFLSMTTTSLTIISSSSINLWVLLRFQVLCLSTMDIILSLFFKTE